VWALQYDGVASSVNTILLNTGLSISSFGIDEGNELYFCTLDGKIYALMANGIPEFPSSTIIFVLLIATSLLVASISRKNLN
jgi:hypothetical protein